MSENNLLTFTDADINTSCALIVKSYAPEMIGSTVRKGLNDPE